MDLSNINLLDLQTLSMKNDPTTVAMCESLNPQFQQLANETKLCLIYSRIDYLSEDILDELAYELHIEWYDATAPIEVKRNLVKNSDKVHMYLGTPYAIEQVIQDFFGDGEVEEWFDYGGQPFYFNVITSNPSVTTELATQFTKAIESVKRKSTRLDQIIITLYGQLDMFLAGVVHTGDNYTVRQVF